jgi:rubredoxin
MSNEIHCPKCNSTQIVANKKGFSGKKAVAGAILTGGIGILAGTLGSDKIIITCLACGHKFKPGEGKTETIPDDISTPVVSSVSKEYIEKIERKVDDPPTVNNGCAIALIILVAIIALYLLL